jgi:hypothetical protein
MLALADFDSAPPYSSKFYNERRTMMTSANFMSMLKEATWRSARWTRPLRRWFGYPLDVALIKLLDSATVKRLRDFTP